LCGVIRLPSRAQPICSLHPLKYAITLVRHTNRISFPCSYWKIKGGN